VVLITSRVNYDDEWDSDPADARGKETAFEKSGVPFRMLVNTGLFISGHLHKDGMVVCPGDRIGDGRDREKPRCSSR
jgi:hypothetical protein